MSSSYSDEGRGPLSGIEANASKEIGKLWTNWENRTVNGADQSFVTNAQLTAQVNALTDRIDALSAKPSTVVQQVAGGGSSSSASLDLRPLNNKWTGTNQWVRGELPGINNFQFLGLTSGLITSFTTPNSILLETGAGNYQALIDVQKSSDASVFGGFIGGNAAIYVQHRSGGFARQDYGAYGIRVQVESTAISVAPVQNAMAAGYFSVQNAGINCVGFALKLDVTHKGGGATATYGVQVGMNRINLDGKTVGVHIQSTGQLNDYGVLMSGPTRVDRAISVGSAFLGPLACNVGIDLTYANTSMAVMTGVNQRIVVNGPNTSVGFYYDPVGRIQFFSDLGANVSIANNGTLQSKFLQVDAHMSAQSADFNTVHIVSATIDNLNFTGPSTNTLNGDSLTYRLANIETVNCGAFNASNARIDQLILNNPPTIFNPSISSAIGATVQKGWDVPGVGRVALI